MAKKPTTTRARRTRAERSRIYAQLGTSKTSVADLLEAPPPALAGEQLYRLLLRQPGIGEARVRKICEGALVWPLTRVGQLTDPQRAAIIDEISVHH
jgi:hypothetical protein